MITVSLTAAPADDNGIDITTAQFWQGVGAFFVGAGWNLLSIAGILAASILAAWILKRVIRRVVDRIVSGAKSKANVDDTQSLEQSPLASVRVVQRTRTLGSILFNVINITIVVIAIMLIVNVVAPTALGSLTLLTAAVGAGLGFGAQNIVKDVLNGIFIVAEDQVGIGDVVDLGLATGIVEYVSVRVTHVRDVNGTLWYVRNGEITRIGNLSQGWSRVIIDLSVAVDSDIAEVEKTMLDTAKTLAADPSWRSRILEEPEVWGLESISGDALVIRLVMKTRAAAKDDVARELRVRLKHAIDEMGITLPALAAVMPTGLEGAQRARGGSPPRMRPAPVPPGERPVWKPKVTDEKKTTKPGDRPASGDSEPGENS